LEEKLQSVFSKREVKFKVNFHTIFTVALHNQKRENSSYKKHSKPHCQYWRGGGYEQPEAEDTQTFSFDMIIARIKTISEYKFSRNFSDAYFPPVSRRRRLAPTEKKGREKFLFISKRIFPWRLLTPCAHCHVYITTHSLAFFHTKPPEKRLFTRDAAMVA
jgi:hypothetical protein